MNLNDQKHRLEKRMMRVEFKQNILITLLCLVFVTVIYPEVGSIVLASTFFVVAAAFMGKTIGRFLSRYRKNKKHNLSRIEKDKHPHLKSSRKRQPFAA